MWCGAAGESGIAGASVGAGSIAGRITGAATGADAGGDTGIEAASSAIIGADAGADACKDAGKGAGACVPGNASRPGISRAREDAAVAGEGTSACSLRAASTPRSSCTMRSFRESTSSRSLKKSSSGGGSAVACATARPASSCETRCLSRNTSSRSAMKSSRAGEAAGALGRVHCSEVVPVTSLDWLLRLIQAPSQMPAAQSRIAPGPPQSMAPKNRPPIPKASFIAYLRHMRRLRSKARILRASDAPGRSVGGFGARGNPGGCECGVCGIRTPWPPGSGDIGPW